MYFQFIKRLLEGYLELPLHFKTEMSILFLGRISLLFLIFIINLLSVDIEELLGYKEFFCVKRFSSLIYNKVLKLPFSPSLTHEISCLSDLLGA